MIRYLTLLELLELYQDIMQQFGGSPGLRDQGLLEAALSQPRQTFGGEELYPTVSEKAIALAFSLIRNHPFVDGNKRIGYAALRRFLVLNGYDIVATVDEKESVILQVAAGEMGREEFTEWLRNHLVELPHPA